jgi:hypothetical protein
LQRKKGDPKQQSYEVPSIHHPSLFGSSVCEFYTYGHDVVSSALNGGLPKDESSTEPSCPAIELSKLLDRDLSNLAVLFGGVGDARHVLTTLRDVFDQWKDLDAAKKRIFRIHLVWNDINPAALARDTLMIAGLLRFGTLGPEMKDCYDPQKESFKIAIMLQYTFFGYTMPPVCL